jgi:ubiquinone/menaquinone biosynthesis C-methylase UbiE
MAQISEAGWELSVRAQAVETKSMTPAEIYEKHLVPALFGPWAKRVLAGSGPAKGQSALDVACGTGVGTRMLAEAVGPEGSVVGLDNDEAMLATAGAIAPSPSAAPIRWQQASADDMPFPDQAFDLILCLEGIQFFPNRTRAVREMRRVLRPQGILVASVWGAIEHNPGYAALAEGLKKFISPEAANLAALSLSDPLETQRIFEAAGFAKVEVKVCRLDVVFPSSAALVDWMAGGAHSTRHKLALLDHAKRQEFYAFVASHLTKYKTDRGLLLPSCRNVCVASGRR